MKKMMVSLVALVIIFFLVACSNSVGEASVSSEGTDSCTLIVDVQAFGWTEDGKNLTDNWSDNFIVHKGNPVYQTYRGHYSIEEPENSAGIVFTIKSISKDVITIELNNHNREVSFGEKIEMDSLVYANDGQNYIFTIHFEELKAN